jgi:preprotein translocase subunit SecY
MIVNEQGKKVAQRKMSSIMWDTFTGSAPYKGIFFRSLNPAVLSSLLWNILTAVISPIAKETKDKSRDKN